MKRANCAVAVVALLAGAPAFALAQKPVSKMAAVEVTTTIVALDKTTRLVTIKGPDGQLDTIYAGPQVKRFDELKVGDTVTFRYSESVVYQVRKPGEPAAAASASASEPVVTRGKGPRPGATIADQQTATVKVTAVDMETPSLTVLTDDGRTLSFKVDDKKNLKGVTAGDRVEITYTTAILISVK
jgi:hypothetical protein